MMEWRDGQMLDDEELEELYDQRPDVTGFDAFICIALFVLGGAAIWAAGTLVFYEIYQRWQ